MEDGNGRRRADTSWNEQFESSLRRWSAMPTLKNYGTQLPVFTSPLQKIVDDAIQTMLKPDKKWPREGAARLAKLLKETEQTDAVAKAIRAILHLYASELLNPVVVGLTKCESPIELPMFLALFIVGGTLGTGAPLVSLAPDGVESWGERDHMRLAIAPQAELGEHRVDFLLTLHYGISDIQTQPDGSWLGWKVLDKRMVVECDGHDFHDRTKGQAKKDRARDRFLQSLGIRVFRYTGSDIWEDVFKCAHQAVATLVDEASKEWAEGEERYLNLNPA